MSKAREQVEFNRADPIQTYKNKLINGGFDVWQRGTSFSNITSNAFLADGWRAVLSGDTIDVSAGGIFVKDNNAFPYILISPTVSNGLPGIEQRIEFPHTLSNKTVTFSFLVNVNEDTTFRLYWGTNTSGSTAYNYTIPTIVHEADGWVKLTHTFTIEDMASYTFDSDDFFNMSIRKVESTLGGFRIAQVQLEEGSVATPFEQRPIGTELVLCRRYFMLNPGLSGMVSGTGTDVMFPIDTRNMRDLPSVSLFGDTTSVVIKPGIATYDVSAVSITADRSYLTLIATVAGTTAEARTLNKDVVALTAEL